jgi:hypothetical protein
MKRKYGLFEKVAGKWKRLPGPALEKESAIRVYQTQLIYGTCEGQRVQLRVVTAPWMNP